MHKIVEGGATREHSVLKGILACDKEIGYGNPRCGASAHYEEIITEAVETAMRDSTAAPGVACKDSIQVIKNGKMVQNVARRAWLCIQTPQCLILIDLCGTHQGGIRCQFDDR